MELLKFIACGSVDDGKSTLIGHMLYDARLLYADQKQALERDSRVGNCNGEIDYSLLLDGLVAEREQGITIDVAYRYFSTEKRSFIVADTPGHEEYTRNMAVGASYAQLAVILVDATKGVLIQTKRHARICSLFGIKNYVFVINKMDLVDYCKESFSRVSDDISSLSKMLGLSHWTVIPVSAKNGDNVTKHSKRMNWYDGSSLLEYLENVYINTDECEYGFVLPIQSVCRPYFGFRGFQGQVETGILSIGDKVTVLPSREEAVVVDLYNTDQKTNQIERGQAVTVCLDKEIDISRGCVLAQNHALKVSNMFRATILWMEDTKLVEGKTYQLKIGTKLVAATIIKLEYCIDINTGERILGTCMDKNEIAVCQIVSSETIVFDCFSNCMGVGHFILIDKVTNATAACGIVTQEINRLENLFWQNMDITREMRSKHMSQEPCTLWFTGLSGAGKTTLANEIEKKLVTLGKYTMSLDGDNIRLGLNQDLGFSESDRVENLRRVAEVAKLMNDAGLIVLTSFISPFISERRRAKEIIGEDNFIEIYVSTPIEECEKRDVKGLYKKARNAEIVNFTGISSEYEKPLNPDITIDTTGMTMEESVEYIWSELKKYLKRPAMKSQA